MSSTNNTTYYELPQYIESDIFNPLVDDNDAYDKIDTALHNIANAEAENATDIETLTSAVSGFDTDIEALKTQNGSETLTTDSQTLSGGINELKAGENSLDMRLDIVEDDINNITTGLKAKVATNTRDISLIKNSYITPEMFGAVGDGVTDDSTAFQLALDAIGILICKNTYKISSGLTVPTGVKIIGGGTILIDNDGNDFDLFTIGSMVEISEINFEDTASAYSNTDTSVITATSKEFIKIDNCKFTDIHFRYNIKISESRFIDITNNDMVDYGYSGIMLWDGCEYANIENNRVIDAHIMIATNQYAISFSAYDATTNRVAAHVIIRNNYIDGNGWTGLDGHGVIDCIIENNTIVNVLKAIMLVTPSNGIVPTDINCNISIKNNYIEYDGADSSGIAITNTAAVVIHDIDIVNNIIKGTNGTQYTSAYAAIGIRTASELRNIHIASNIISAPNLGIIFDSGTAYNVVVENNDISGMTSDAGYAINFANLTTYHAIVAKDNYIHDVVRGIRFTTQTPMVDDLIKAFNNTIIASGDEAANTTYSTYPDTSLNANTKAKGLHGDFIPCKASGTVAGWYCLTAGSWLEISGTAVV